jgi:DNA-nicking Smr family endonuclease
MVNPAGGKVLILVNRKTVCAMTSKDERLAFLEEMQDVRRIRKPNRAEVSTPRELTPGHLERQRSAVEQQVKDRNPLTADMVEPLTAQDVLSWQRPGVQHGVFKKLRLGQYPIEARLDLHRMTVEEARREVFGFINDCVRYGLRSVIILHGKGERNPDRIAHIKSHIAKWLPELDDVLAFHSAQKHHGGTGAVYVMVRKGDRDKQRNREIHGGH